MKKTINSPLRSKINATAAITSATNVGIYFLAERGFIPADAVIDALVVGNVAAQALIAVLRSWFTKP
jgi:hypothetical protein